MHALSDLYFLFQATWNLLHVVRHANNIYI